MKRHLSLAALALTLVFAAAPVLAASAAPTASTAKQPAATAAAPAKTAPAKSAPAKPAGKMEAPASDAGKVDLNTATKEQLMKVPGIAEATAAKIVAGRPFKMKSDLVSKGIVNKAQYAKLAQYVVARQK